MRVDVSFPNPVFPCVREREYNKSTDPAVNAEICVCL